jgi:hypothetical protein
LSSGKNVQQTEKDLKKFSQKNLGINSIYRSSISPENIVQHAGTRKKNAPFAR